MDNFCAKENNSGSDGIITLIHRWKGFLFYVRIIIKRGLWTEDEDLYMLELAIEEGLKWSNIAKRLGNRTENAVKNRMKSLINK